MKKFISLCMLVSLVGFANAQVKFDALSFQPTYPQQSQTLNFSFDQKLSPLKNEKEIGIVIYEFSDFGLKVKEPSLKKTGTVYTGSIKLDSNTNTVAFGISSPESKDNNNGKGYLLPVYDKNKQALKGYYVNAGQLHAGYGEYLFGMDNVPQKNLDMLEAGMQKHPELSSDAMYYGRYLAALSSVKKAEAQPIILEKLEAIEKKSFITEAEYSMLANWYTRLKMKPRADSLQAVMKAKYPNGKWVVNEQLNKFYAEKDVEKKKELYEAYKKTIGADKNAENNLVNMRSQIAAAYGREKNMALLTEWANELPIASRAALYNDLSWNMAEKGENLAEAKKMSEEATFWAKKEMDKPEGKKPESMTTKQWNEQRQMTFSMYGDTYAFILYHLGEYKEGLAYAKEAAMIRKLKDPEYNERYAMLLEKAAPASEAKPIIVDMVKAGKASSKTKDALKAIYVKEGKAEADFDKYLAELEKEAMEKKKEEIVKSMINTAAPKFALKDWDGNEVSLASLKGKVLVVDFWATWCGPCIASMPGMKKAQEKLSGRDDVKFLFVDTWESVDNKLENAKDFMKKNNYPFYVLMDNDNKMVEDFGVNGIPTKFIVDKHGNIRFKSVGFEGNTDALADEVVMMVEMASK